uniref:Uncharacterized protein n=1 Tax=Ursus maritimus TaxID=29073 RepID=A0A452U1J7_URSMA
VHPDPGPPASGHPPVAPSLPSLLSADGAFIPSRPCPLVSPILPSEKGREARKQGDKGNLTWAPPPRSPCASPITSWKRRGPREGASPTSLLSSTHCWNGHRVHGRGAGLRPGWEPRNREDSPARALLPSKDSGEGGLGLGPVRWAPLGPPEGLETGRPSQASCSPQSLGPQRHGPDVLKWSENPGARVLVEAGICRDRGLVIGGSWAVGLESLCPEN